MKEKLIKIGAKIASHGRYVAFQMAEIVILRNLFAKILRLIAELWLRQATSTAYGVCISGIWSPTHERIESK